MNAETLVGTVLGTCTLQKLIGQGSVGAVFLAQQSRPNRQVAVKVLLPLLPLSPNQRAAYLEHFSRRADVIASLEHPNIIPLHEYGEHNGLPYLVMPYINGGTLSDEMEREGPLLLTKVAFYIEQLAAALTYAHEHGVIHHNIKPTNILLRREGQLWLTDFGLMQMLPASGNAPASAGGSKLSSGSYDYMAPEQVTGRAIDTRTDIYALGVLLYQMVTDSLPFKGGTRQRLQILLQPPRELRPDLPAAAEQVILQALAKRPVDRYVRVLDFANSFRQALIVSGIPVVDFGSVFAYAMPSDIRFAASVNTADPVASEQEEEPAAAPPSAGKVGKHARRNDIVGLTSMTLPSLSGFDQPTTVAVPASVEQPAPTSIVQENVSQSSSIPSQEQKKIPSIVPEIPPDVPTVQENTSQLSPLFVGEQKLILRAPTASASSHPLSQTSPVNAGRPLATSVRGPGGSGPRSTTLPPLLRADDQAKASAKGLRLLLIVALLAVIVSVSFAYIYPTLASPRTPAPTQGDVHNIAANNNNMVGNNNANNAVGNGGSGSRSFQVGAHAFIVIQGHAGNVNVQTGSAGTVMITPKNPGSGSDYTGTNVQYNQSQSGSGQDRINVQGPALSDIDYTLTMPATAQIQVQVDTGSVAVDGGSGVTVDTSSGNLDIEDVQGPVNVQTDSGDITTHNITGQTTVETSSGSIRMDGINGQLKAITQNGDVIVKNAALSSQSILKTTNGSVRLFGSLNPQGNYTLETSRGDVDLTLPDNATFQISASTGSGSIQNEFGAATVGAAPRAQITARIEDGGSVIVTKAI